MEINLDDLKEAVIKLREEFMEIDDGGELALIWLVRVTSIRKGLLDALKFTSIYLVYASYFIFILAGIIIFTIFRRNALDNQKNYGSLSAFGFPRNEITRSFYLRGTVLFLISTPFTFLLSTFLSNIIVNSLAFQWGVQPSKAKISIESFIITEGILLFFILFFSNLSIRKILKQSPVELINTHGQDVIIHTNLYNFFNLFKFKTLKYAMRDITRNQTRSFLTVISLIIGISFAGSLLHTNSTISHTVDDFYENNVTFDVEIDLGLSTSIAIQENLQIFLSNIDSNNDNISDIKLFEFFLNTPIQFLDDPELITIFQAVNHDTQMFQYRYNSIIEGRWFQANSSEIVISKYVADNFDLSINNKITFPILNIVLEFNIVGIINELHSTSSIIGDIDNISHLIRPLPDRKVILANKILLQIQDDISIDALVNFVNRNIPEITLMVDEQFYHDRIDAFTSSQAIITDFIMILGFILAFIISLSMFNLNFIERQQEYQLMNIFGVSKLRISLQYFIESFILIFISITFSLIFSVILTEFLWIGIIESSFFIVVSNYSLLNHLNVIFSSLLILVLSTGPNIIKYNNVIENAINSIRRLFQNIFNYK